MTTPAGEDMDVGVREVTREEAWAMLDADCRRVLGISVEEFAERYNAGYYDDPDDHPKVMELGTELEFLQHAEASR